MRMIATPAHANSSTPAATTLGPSRGIVILGLAAVSWMVVAGMWVGLSQLFGLVAATL